MNSYDQFSFCYRELITTSGHLHKEQQLVKEICGNFSIDHSAAILDAACGTGDLLLYLRTAGYAQSTGMDGSPGMLSRAKEILPFEFLSCKRWEEMDAENQYDLILILSVSLLHANQADLPLIFKNIYKALKNNGVLVFDNRKWKKDMKYGLIEPGRAINERRYLQELDGHGGILQIADLCTYENGRQTITYIVSDQRSEEQQISVSYLMLKTADFFMHLSEAGFSLFEKYNATNWPYEVIYARR